MSEKMWFGNVAHAQWVPVPRTGMQRQYVNYTDEIEFTNGGMWLERSAASHSIFPMEFPVADATEYEGIEAFSRFASGEYGLDYLRFVDPMMSDQNLFTQNWAAPGLAENGWKGVYDTTPTFSDTGANSYNKPLRKVTYSITDAANAVPTGQNSVFTLLIPTGYTLHLGGSGSVTGSAVLRVRPINQDGSLAAVVSVTLTSDASAPSFSSSFSSATYKAVRVYVTRSSSAASTITLTSLWAQIAPTSAGVPTIARHIPGKGHTGLKIRGNSRPETYIMKDRHLIGASIELAEVESWA